MVRKPVAAAPTSAKLSTIQALEALPRLEQRLREAQAIDPSQLTEESGSNTLSSLATKINTTLRSAFGENSIEYHENRIDSFEPEYFIYTEDTDLSIRGNVSEIASKLRACVARLETLIELLREQLGPAGGGDSHVLTAYKGLELHPEIARASTPLYLDGHYSNAVESAVKALNGLVRLRTGLETDGSTLMERAFNPSTPALRFNALEDQSDKDEQRGFMMMFSGAVAGLRNPRAHGFVQDDPERALEFIAFVSLLAKLLDGAKR